jgi:hypothetical protein
VMGFGCGPSTLWLGAGVRRPKASKERTRGMAGAVPALWGFDVCAWSAAVELTRLVHGDVAIDGQGSLAGVAPAIGGSLQAGRFRRVEL